MRRSRSFSAASAGRHLLRLIPLLLACGGLGHAGTAAAQPSRAQTVHADCLDSARAPVAREVRAHRALGAIKIDGRLDEPDWARPSGPPLVQNEPDNGCLPSQRTDWWIVFDDEALYVGARLWDSAPESIGARLGRRDTWPASDWLVICFDTFNDDRNGYLFGINPAGVRGDAIVYNDGWDDPSWDGVWEAEARIDGEGWTAEMRVPFAQLSFPDRPEQVWGVNVSRRILRRQERQDLYHRPRNESGVVRRYPDLTGIAGIAPSDRRELLAYLAGRGEYLRAAEENPFRDGACYAGDAGADLRWGLSPQLTLNATVNPDFGQVEVDPAVVNLSDYETFFEERRPFFVEDANVLRFGREGTSNNWNFNWMDPIPFYSRRIGRAPQLPLPEHDHAEAPGATTIMGAAKLTGKVGRTHIGALTALTAGERAEVALGDGRARPLIEPLASYSVVRLKRPSADGRRGAGIMATGAWRETADPRAAGRLAHLALTAGADGWLTLDDAAVWALKGYISASHVAGAPAAIDGLQRSSRRYYQRPDAGHLGYDPARQSLEGWAGRLMLNKEAGSLTLNTAFGAISPGYEINDLGFQYRADQLNHHLALGHRWTTPNRTFRHRQLTAAAYRTWDYNGTPDNLGYGVFANAQLGNYWWLEGRWFHAPQRNSNRATRGGPRMRVPEADEMMLFLSTDGRRAVQVSASGSASREGDGSRAAGGSLEVTVRPSAALRLSLGPSALWQRNNTQWVANVEDPAMTATAGVRHVFAALEYRELSLPARVDWTFTPRLTLQSYLQPLLAAGRYAGLREFARAGGFAFAHYGRDHGSTLAHDGGVYTIDPDGDGPAAPFRLGDPDFNFKSLRINLVLRWEYRPGSTFYLVWTQDRVDLADPGRISLRRDLDSLLSAPGDNIVMVKISNWLRI